MPRRMPSAQKIRAYWWPKLVELGRFDSEAEVFEGEYCFACGQEWPHRKLQRAHIVPRVKGGSDDVSNLHLLCDNCHKASEGFEDPAEYWAWFEQRTFVDAFVQAYFNTGGRLADLIKE